MRILVGVPIFAVLAMLQSTVFSRISIIHGTSDLMMVFIIAWSLQEQVTQPWWWAGIAILFTSLITAMPIVAIVVPYVIVLTIALIVRRRIWQTPILVMLAMTIIATLIQHITQLITLAFGGTFLSLQVVQSQITLPSALLNVLLSLPVYLVVRDLARAMYQNEEYS